MLARRVEDGLETQPRSPTLPPRTRPSLGGGPAPSARPDRHQPQTQLARRRSRGALPDPGQRELERRASAGLRTGPYLAAVGLDDRLADAQPHADAAGLGGEKGG